LKISNLFADAVNYLQQSDLYGPPQAFEHDNSSVTPIIIISAIGVGIVAGLVVLIRRKLKKCNNNSSPQGLYGPPSMFEPPEDLYGCPRPDDLDSEIVEEENNKE